MSTIQTISKDIQKNFSDYKISDLEQLLKDTRLVIQKKRLDDKQAQELRLLEKLNKCVLPEGHLERFILLQRKQKSETGITKKEGKELEKLINEELKWQTQRVKILGELAELKQISLSELANQLGILPK